jgi:hypothetical protein
MTLLLKKCCTCSATSYLFDDELAVCCEAAVLTNIFIPAYITKTTKSPAGYSRSDFMFETKQKNVYAYKVKKDRDDALAFQKAASKFQARRS